MIRLNNLYYLKLLGVFTAALLALTSCSKGRNNTLGPLPVPLKAPITENSNQAPELQLKEGDVVIKVSSTLSAKEKPYRRRFTVAVSEPVKEAIHSVRIYPKGLEGSSFVLRREAFDQGFEFDYERPTVSLVKVDVKMENGRNWSFERRIRSFDRSKGPLGKALGYFRVAAEIPDLYSRQRNPFLVNYFKGPRERSREPNQPEEWWHPEFYIEADTSFVPGYALFLDWLEKIFRWQAGNEEAYPDLEYQFALTSFDPYVLDLDLSTDETQIVFNHVMGTPMRWTRPMWDYNDLYRMNSDGTFLTRLTNSNTVKERPNFSPDGTYILYTEGENPYPLDIPKPKRRLMLLDLATMKSTPITDGKYDDFRGVFSPDGKEIAYSSFDGRKAWLKIITPEGKPVKTFDIPLDVYDPSYSPDGEMLCFVCPLPFSEEIREKYYYPIWRFDVNQIHIVNRDGTGFRRVEHYWWHADKYGGPERYEIPSGKPQFSPDGELIYFIDGIAPWGIGLERPDIDGWYPAYEAWRRSGQVYVVHWKTNGLMSNVAWYPLVDWFTDWGGTVSFVFTRSLRQ